jgi:hypothetical protein
VREIAEKTFVDSVEGFSAWGSGQGNNALISHTPSRGGPRKKKSNNKAKEIAASPRLDRMEKNATRQSDFIEFDDAETPTWRFRPSLLGEKKEYNFKTNSELASSANRLSDASALVACSNLAFNHKLDIPGVLQPSRTLKKSHFSGVRKYIRDPDLANVFNEKT